MNATMNAAKSHPLRIVKYLDILSFRIRYDSKQTEN